MPDIATVAISAGSYTGWGTQRIDCSDKVGIEWVESCRISNLILQLVTLRCRESFGSIIANGIIAAAKDVKIAVPLVVRLEGTNADLGKKILQESGLKLEAADDLGDAAKKIVNAIS